jgi:hypothetical protein
MIGKLPKSEAWKQSDLVRPGHLLTQGTRAETLCQNPMDSDKASVLEQTRAEKPCWTLKDSDRASTLELRGGFPTGQEALQPSEPRHSPNKATPSYYTKNESFASGIFM